MKNTINLEGKEYIISDELVAKIKGEVNVQNVWPKIDDTYYYVQDTGDIEYAYWNNDYIDHWRKSQGNCFKTKEETTQHKLYLESLARIKESTHGFVPDWSNKSKKWGVFYDNSGQRLIPLEYSYLQIQSTTYFENKNNAQNSIDTLKDDWLRVFGVNN